MPVTLDPAAGPEAAATIRRGLYEFNTATIGQGEDFTPLVIAVRDESGAIQGGLVGGTYWGWLVIEILWLDASLRGHGLGTQLVAQAEQEARARGCHGAHLDTTSWQALDFYLRLGYTVFGQLDDLPTGHSRYFLQKPLADQP